MTTIEQLQLKKEMLEQYDIEANQISVDEKGNPIFDYEALSLLALHLAPHIRKIETSPGATNAEYVTADCVVCLDDGRARSSFGHCWIGETAPDGTEINTGNKAMDFAQARALRRGLRSVGFDPLKAHRKQVIVPVLSQAEQDRKAIHAMRDEMKMTEPEYRGALHRATQRNTTEDMDEQKLALARSYFSALIDARTRKAA